MWTKFMDMHSGGDQKLDYAYIFIEAPEAEAKVIFYNRFGRNPERVTCTCCGSDYSTNEAPTFEEASAYERGCEYDNSLRRYVDKPSTRRNSFHTYKTVEEYKARPDILVIPASEIKDEERRGEVPDEGYIWVG